MYAVMMTAGLLASGSTSALAQTPDEQYAWAAMMYTPAGALPRIISPAMVAPSGTTQRPAGTIEFGYAHWSIPRVRMLTALRLPARSFKDDLTYNTFGAGFRVANIGVTAAYQSCETCYDGIAMGGLDYPVTLLRTSSPIGAPGSSFALGVRPAVGYGWFTSDKRLAALSATIDAPASLTLRAGRRLQIVPFLAPGFSWGRLTTAGAHTTGTLGSVAAGIGFLPSREFALHAGWRKILTDDAAEVFSFGVSFGPLRR